MQVGAVVRLKNGSGKGILFSLLIDISERIPYARFLHVNKFNSVS
jgi:hypothetical protein